jgi:serine/threonine protein phosphatase 1
LLLGDEVTIYAVGDIHGQRAELERVIDWIDRDGGAQAEVVFVGDYIDRGPDSRGVIDLLIDGRAAGRNWTCLLGNHDRMFGNFIANGTILHPRIKSGLAWTHERLGGRATLASYGIDARADRDASDLWADACAAIPDAHAAFLHDCPLFAERDGLLFVHAGIRPKVALADQIEADLIWIRDDFLLHREAFDWLVVHGHTAVTGADHRGNRVNLDGGAGFGRPLRVAGFEDRTAFELTNNGRQMLKPGSWGQFPA